MSFLTSILLFTFIIIPQIGFSYIGGKNIDLSLTPYVVAFPFLECTGAKINNNLFLLAAHCLAKDSPFSVVNPGDQLEILYYSSGNKLNSIKVTIKNISISPSFISAISESNSSNQAVARPKVIDHAYIEIEESTPSIPKGEVLLESFSKDAQIFVGGFGCQSSTDNIAQRFRTKKNLSYTFSSKSIEKVSSLKMTLSENDFNSSQKSYACFGDSGGPATIIYQNRSYIIGVNSYLDSKNKLTLSLFLGSEAKKFYQLLNK